MRREIVENLRIVHILAACADISGGSARQSVSKSVHAISDIAESFWRIRLVREFGVQIVGQVGDLTAEFPRVVGKFVEAGIAQGGEPFCVFEA